MDSINDLLCPALQQNDYQLSDCWSDLMEVIGPELNGNLMETDNETEAATMIPAATTTPVIIGYAVNQPTNPEVALQPIFSGNSRQAADVINQSLPTMESLSLQEEPASSNIALFSIRPMNEDNEVTSTGYSGSPSNTPSPATVTTYFSGASSPRGSLSPSGSYTSSSGRSSPESKPVKRRGRPPGSTRAPLKRLGSSDEKKRLENARNCQLYRERKRQKEGMLYAERTSLELKNIQLKQKLQLLDSELNLLKESFSKIIILQ